MSLSIFITKAKHALTSYRVLNLAFELMGYWPIIALLLAVAHQQPTPSVTIVQPKRIEMIKQALLQNADLTVPYLIPPPS
jgi:hypothetical protein